MKKVLICLFLALNMAVASAYPIRIQSWDIPRDVKAINALNLSIERVNHDSGVILVEVRDQAEHDLLTASGFDAQRIPDPSREYYQYLMQTTKDSDNPMGAYYSIDQYHSFMQDTANLYPQICQLVQFGSSVQNRPLYIMKISDNVTINEAEPEVKLIASIHGDETVGYDLMIRLIDLLTSEYGSDPRITDIVNNTELWISPLMNPDGYVNGERYNAAGVDLNRNFPMPNGVTNPDGNPTAAENLAMIDFSHEHNFLMGINFHGGALVINYPWDYTYALTPDDALIQDISLTYSTHNLPMYNSNEFDQGITNGAQWYVITGSMQDWNYGFTGNIELTAEVSNIKWPPSSTLDNYWAENQESILSFIEYAQKGIKGTVTGTGAEPIPATIEILGNSKITRNDPVVGDYHRLLLPGEYEVKISSPGYIPQTATVTVPNTGHVVHDMALEAATSLHLYGTVKDRDGFALPNVQIQLNADEEYSVTTAADGSFYVDGILEGDYQAQFSRPGHGAVQQQIELRSDRYTSYVVFVLDDPLFYEDFEADLSSWNVSSPWAIIQEDGNGVLTDSPGGNYGNNINRAISLSDPVSLVGIQDPVLSFAARWDLESGYDYVYVEGSNNGSNWTQLGSFTGNQPEWTDQYFPLDGFNAGAFYLRFRIRTDWSQTADGIYIDDVCISGRDTSSPLFGDVNQDGIIDSADIQELLDYTVGGELSADQLINADVDLIDGVKTVDAQQILHYMHNPDFRFPAQNSEAYTLPEIQMEAELNGTYLHLSNDPSLRSLHLNIPYPITGMNTYLEDDPPYYAYGDGIGLFSTVHNHPFMGEYFVIQLHEPEENFVIDAEVNGHTVQIQVGEGSTSPDNSPTLPITLRQNYPNPFNPETTISVYLPKPQEVDLEVFNVRGQALRCLAKGSFPAGEHSFVFDGKDASGRKLGTGLYLYRLTTEGGTITKKMVLSK